MPARAAVHHVVARVNYYDPGVVHAAAGDTIKWTVAAGSHDVVTYGGVANFQSPMMNPASLPYEFGYQGGVVLYRCTPHSSLSAGGTCVGMCGAITDTTSAPATPTITRPANGSRVETDPVTFAGGGEAWTTVRLTESGSQLAEVLVRGNQMWTIGVRMPAGTHTVSARAYNVDGTPSPSAAMVTFTVGAGSPDTTPPAVRLTSESLDVFFGEARLEGTATDNFAVARVFVDVYDAQDAFVKRVAAACGACPAPTVAWLGVVPLPPGFYKLYAVAQDTATPPHASAPAGPSYALVLP